MLILKKRHDIEVKYYNTKISYLLKENGELEKQNREFEKQRDNEYKENRLLVSNLEMLNNRNMNLSQKNKKIAESNFKTNAKLLNDLDQANKKIRELENRCKKLEKRKVAFEKLYRKYKDLTIKVNTVNVSVMRKLWANKEAQRQLRRLADNEEVNNIHTLRRYVKELAMLIGI